MEGVQEGLPFYPAKFVSRKFKTLYGNVRAGGICGGDAWGTCDGGVCDSGGCGNVGCGDDRDLGDGWWLRLLWRQLVALTVSWF